MKKHITIVYEIADEFIWRNSGNPLLYEHHGLRATCVSIGDRIALLDDLEAAIASGDGLDRDLFDELDRKHRV